MAVFQSEDRQRMRRVRSERAIQLAMQNKWQEAAELNRQILEHFPDDVDTLNRLGKALMELGQYADSRDQYARATKADPSNGIAAKNLVLKAIDFELRLPSGDVFVAETPEGVTAMVLLGEGTLVFQPTPKEEKGQL